MKFYKLNCKFCKKPTAHSIYHQSRKKGVKLFCLDCDAKQNRYYNLQKLEEFE